MYPDLLISNWWGYLCMMPFVNEGIIFLDLVKLCYYLANPSSYHAIVTDLSPDITEREYGRVFFSTQTTYTLRTHKITQGGQYTPPKGFHRQGTKKIYSKTFVKANRFLLYKENHNGSILRTPTTLGYILDNFFQYKQSIQYNHTYVPFAHYLTHYRDPRLNQFPTRQPDSQPRIPEEGLTTRALFTSIRDTEYIHDWTSWLYDPTPFTIAIGNQSTIGTHHHVDSPYFKHSISP